MAKTAKTASFADILDMPAADVEKPKGLPAGSYQMLVSGLPEHGKSAKKQTPYVEFTCKILSAGDDVDEDELKAWATRADGSTRPLTDATTKATYYTTPDAIWRLTTFLEHLGLDVEGKSIRDLLEEAPNCQFTGYIRHEPSQDGQMVFSRLGNTAPAE